MARTGRCIARHSVLHVGWYIDFMKSKDDRSYGVIPIIFENGSWKVFLIHQYGSAGDVYWTFPKGHAEENETSIEAALRELVEETGIILKRLREGLLFTQTYTFMHADVLIHKSVEYYVGEAASKDHRLQEEEVKDAGWFTFEDAREKLTFDAAKAMLSELEIALSKE